MEEQTHFALQVIRVHTAPSDAKEARFYVEVKFAKSESVRKTGILNDEGEPGWNDTMTFQKLESASIFEVHVKKLKKVGRDDLIGQAKVNVEELLANSIEDNTRVVLFAPPSFRSSRKRSSSIGSIRLHLKKVDALNRAKIEVEMAERGADRIRTLTNKTDSTMEVIGTVIEAADVIIEMVDTVAKIHPVFDVSWQAVSALYKVISHQLHTDKELIELIKKMRTAFEFSTEVGNLDDKTKMLKPIVKNLLGETAECSRFVQKYTEYNFFGRMGRFGSGRKISDYSARFVDLRNELDSVISLNTAKEVLNIKLQQQLEALLEPFKSEASNVSSRPRCLDGTRREYLDPIMNFLFAETSPNVLWLTGAAGSGKSTIAVTAFENCGDKGCPLAYMFFEREKSDPNSVVRTIAYMLASHHPSIARHILNAVEANKTIRDVAIKKQFEKLLSEPLHAASGLIAGPIVIVLDALDECGSAEQRHELLQLLKTHFTKLPTKIRILITSRPEGDIVEDLAESDCIRRIELKESRHDVDLYIRQEMAKALGKRVPKGKAWDDSVRVLCDAADGLFIWASTAVKMVQGAVNPRRSLEKLINDIRSVGSNGIDSLYVTVLKGSGVWEDNSDSKDEGTAVLGFILVAKESMTGAVIESFLGLEEDTVDSVLGRLRSVVSYEPGKPVRLHHASFADYLLTSERSGNEPWHIDEVTQRQAVTERCFDIMAENLRFNVCHLESSFFRNEDVPDLQTRIANNISPHLDYACRFWTIHLCELSKSVVSGELKDRMKSFGNEHLLYWLEVLSLTGQFNHVAIRALYDASMWSASVDEDIYSLLWAAYRMASVFAYPISQSAPHIYLSAISLWKGESLIADRYSRSHPIVNVDRFGIRTPGQCIKVLQEHTDCVYSIAVSVDGERIVSGSYDGTVRVWNTFSGELIAGPFEVGSGVLSVAFSADGKQVVSGSSGEKIHIWDVDTGGIVSVLKASDSWVTSVAFSPDSRRVISISNGKIFYYENGEPVSAQFEDNIGVEFRKVTPDGKYVLGYNNSMIGVWDAGTGKQVAAPINVGDIVESMTVSPDGKLLATVSLRGICIWNVDSGELVKELSHAGSVYSLTFSPDGRRVVVISAWEIAIWDVDSGQRIWGEHTSRITSVVFTPDGKRVISASNDRTVRIWDVGSTNVASGAFEAHTGSVSSVAFSADGTRTVSGSEDKTVRVWDANGGKHLVGPFEAHAEEAGCELVTGKHYCPVFSVAFSPNGKHFVSPSCNNTICIRDADSGRLVSGPFKGHTGTVYSVGYSPDGRRVVSGSEDQTICIWDADSGNLVLEPLKGHTNSVNSVAFSSNGKCVASGSFDKTICVWDAGTGMLISGPLKGHRDTVRSVCFSPYGKCVVSGSEDKTICIWDADTGELVLGPLEGHTNSVSSVAYSPGGTRIVSGSWDHTIRVWDVGGRGRSGRLARRAVATSSSSHRTDTHTGSNDQGTGPAASRRRTLSNWMLSEDGWVKGEGGELLTWIPEDMRGVLWRLRNTAFIGQFSMKLDLQNSPVGEDWARGYPR